MKYQSYLLITILLSMACTPSKEPITITFTGDFILARGVADEMRLYRDSMLTKSVAPFLDGDFQVINLETVLTDHDAGKKKQYLLKGDPKKAQYLVDVTHASLANNHSHDYGDQGYLDTQEALQANGIVALGTSCEPAVLRKNGQQVAILAASLTTDNNHLCIQDTVQLKKAVSEFNQSHPGIPLIAYLHWGLEYQQTPEQWQVVLARQLIDLGADAIIGHHPHVVQTVELYQHKPILYSLGNFVADAYLPMTTAGAVAQVTILGDSVHAGVQPVDLTTYFPQKMTAFYEIKFLNRNLRYTSGIGYYQSGNQWFVKEIADIDFTENASEWLFPYDDRHSVLLSRLSNGKIKLSILKDGTPGPPTMLHGQLSEIEFADITNDGQTELLLGIAKKVNYDQRYKKRLNVFRIENGRLKVVWLGTKFLNELENFSVRKDAQMFYLHTREIDSVGNSYSRRYQWDQFGFALIE